MIKFLLHFTKLFKFNNEKEKNEINHFFLHPQMLVLRKIVDLKKIQVSIVDYTR